MEIAVVNPQALLQMYPWHLASSPLADKETIIANADFTTTSAIARRRLSSKKRRKPAANLAGGDGGSSSCSDGSASSSPTGSMDSLPRAAPHSPPPLPLPLPPPATTSASTTTSALTTTSHTPPPLDSTTSLVPRALSRFPTTTHNPTHSHTHSHTHQVVPSHPRATAGLHDSVSLVPATYQFAPSLPVGSSALEHPFAHPMYPHLQQELNYRYLQGQSGPSSVRHGNQDTAAFSAPHSRARQHVATAMEVSSSSCESGRPQRIKWCCAHVTMAKQILNHQQQAKCVREGTVVTTESAKPHLAPSSSSSCTTAAGLDPAQQLALLQMYGVPTTTNIPGYMTVPAAAGIPYPAMQAEVQLQNMSFVPHTAHTTALFMDASNILSLKPVPGMTTQASDTSHHGANNIQMINLLPYPQSMPVAAVMPNGTGMNAAGSYVGHIPVPVIGNCVLNPCQPGVMATPWVR